MRHACPQLSCALAALVIAIGTSTTVRAESKPDTGWGGFGFRDADPRFRMQLLIGYRGIEEDAFHVVDPGFPDWANSDSAVGVGIDLEIPLPHLPVALTYTYMASREEQERQHLAFFLPVGIEKAAMDIVEHQLGVRKTWQIAGPSTREGLFFYANGGLTLVDVDVETTRTYMANVRTSASDDTIGYWAGVGLYIQSWHSGFASSVGIDARYIDAEVTLNGTEVGVGGPFVGVSLGVGF